MGIRTRSLRSRRLLLEGASLGAGIKGKSKKNF